MSNAARKSRAAKADAAKRDQSVPATQPEAEVTPTEPTTEQPTGEVTPDPEPESTGLDEGTAKDLRTAYLLAFDSFATDPREVAGMIGQHDNIRYARELLGVLTSAGFTAVENVNDEGDVWQVVNPGTYDTHSRDDAEAVIDAWLASKAAVAPEPEKPSTGGGTSTSKPESVTAEGSPCLCGCGEATGKKSNYRPGHDARHAGQVGRAIAAEFGTPGFDRRELLKALPSEALRDKAEAIAEKATAKANKGAASSVKPDAEPKTEEGTITVGKDEVAAIRTDGVVTRVDGKSVSKTAASTFTVG